eukprot:6822-Heterococcus_DN1.PRE.4
MLTLEKQELRSMFKSFIDGNAKENRGVNTSTAHSDWQDGRATLQGKAVKEVVHGMQYGVSATAQRDQVQAMLCARGPVLPLNPKAPAAIAPGFEIDIETGDAKPVRASTMISAIASQAH